MDKEALSQSNNQTNESKTANTFTCPYCSKSVTLVPYGSGWVGTCCDKIVYNSHHLPPKH